MTNIFIFYLTLVLSFYPELDLQKLQAEDAYIIISTEYQFSYDSSNVFINFQNKNFDCLDKYYRGRAIQDLVNYLVTDLNITNSPSLVYYTSSTDGTYGYYNPNDNTIYLNNHETVSGFNYVTVLSHEMRHCYQAEHFYDDSDYGKALRENNNNYITGLDGNYVGYSSQFSEKDAIEYSEKICSLINN